MHVRRWENEHCYCSEKSSKLDRRLFCHEFCTWFYLHQWFYYHYDCNDFDIAFSWPEFTNIVPLRALDNAISNTKHDKHVLLLYFTNLQFENEMFTFSINVYYYFANVYETSYCSKGPESFEKSLTGFSTFVRFFLNTLTSFKQSKVTRMYDFSHYSLPL